MNCRFPRRSSSTSSRSRPTRIRPTRIYATILVERESQKPIVIGRGGEMIKEIGTVARKEMQEFFRGSVYLDLRVAVRDEWREDPRMLDQLGVKGREK